MLESKRWGTGASQIDRQTLINDFRGEQKTTEYFTFNTFKFSTVVINMVAWRLRFQD